MTTLSQKECEALWGQLRDHFASAEKVLISIIEDRAWFPLGYDTFSQAWNDRMKGVRLATEGVRAHVVYTLLAEGLDDREIRNVIGTQIGDTALVYLREQRDRGVPAGLATTRVKAHDRSRFVAPPRFLRVELRTDELSAFTEIAAARGLDRDAEAAKAIRAHFARLERAVA